MHKSNMHFSELQGRKKCFQVSTSYKLSIKKKKKNFQILCICCSENMNTEIYWKDVCQQ